MCDSVGPGMGSIPSALHTCMSEQGCQGQGPWSGVHRRREAVVAWIDGPGVQLQGSSRDPLGTAPTTPSATVRALRSPPAWEEQLADSNQST